MSGDRLVSSDARETDALDGSIRPQSLDDFIGQEQAGGRQPSKLQITASAPVVICRRRGAQSTGWCRIA